MTSSKTSSAPVASRAVAQQLEEPAPRRDEAHVGRVGLGEDRADSCSATARLTASGSFHGTTIVAAAALRARRGWPGSPASPGPSRPRRAGLHVPVVGAGELQDLLAPRRRARQADRAHRRLGARRRHPDHLHRRHASPTSSASSTSAAVGAPNDVPFAAAAADRGQHLGWAWPWISGPHEQHPVDVRVAVDVDDLRAVRVLDEQRVAPDRAHGPHRRVHASGQDLERPAVQLRRPSVGYPCSASHRLKSSVKKRSRTFLNPVEE